MPIGSIATGAVSGAVVPTATATEAKGTAGTFRESLSALLASVDESAAGANSAVTSMMDGTGDVHQAMIALQKAETSLQLTVQVRNKLVQAYQDVMRMTI